MRKSVINLQKEEKQKLQRLSNRKLISPRALQQVQVILLYSDKKKTIQDITAITAVGSHTINKWVKAFIEKRMDSLLVYKEKGKKRRGKLRITLKNIE